MKLLTEFIPEKIKARKEIRKTANTFGAVCAMPTEENVCSVISHEIDRAIAHKCLAVDYILNKR